MVRYIHKPSAILSHLKYALLVVFIMGAAILVMMLVVNE
jgi:hypothetical protein